MSITNFIYRQKQKLNYHLASDRTEKLIAEINRFEERIYIRDQSFYIRELELGIPKGTFDFIFINFPLFISNAKNLKGDYCIVLNELQFSWEDYRINISSASEIFIINEIFIEKCYQFKLPFNISNDIVVFDIGMNVGLASLFFSKIPHVNSIYGFEPFDPTYQKALKNFSINPLLAEKINTFNFGLGANNKELQIPYSSINTGINSTTTNSRNRLLNETKLEKIIIKDVYAQISIFIKSHPESEVVIKIDTEGAEFEIFERLTNQKLWSNVRIIMLEWHFNSPANIEDYLNDNGFSIISTVINKNAGLIYAFRTN